MGRVAAALGGLVGVVLFGLVLGFVGLVRPASAAAPRHTLVVLRTPAPGKITVAVVKFRAPSGARLPRLRIVGGTSRTATTAVVLGTARVPGERSSYLGLVSIVNFLGSAQAAVTAKRSVISVAANRPLTVDYLGDAATYRGGMKAKLTRILFRAWRVDAYELPSADINPKYRNRRTLLDQVRRLLIGSPDPRFLAAVGGPRVSPPTPPPPAPPPSPPSPPPAPPPPTLIPLSSDPFTNSSSQHRAQVEPDSFSFGSTIVAAFQSGRFFDGGASDIGFATSTNSGVTWTSGFLPSLTKYLGPGTYDRASDPTVAYDAKHGVWLIASLAIDESPVRGVAAVVSRSTNGGLTWSAPVTMGTGTNLDKEWIVCDNHAGSPHYGNCYSEWDEIADSERIKMSTSSDGGLTWGPTRNTIGNATGFSGQPLVQPHGRVIVPIVSPDAKTLLAFDSSDGGLNWSDPSVVSPITVHEAGGNLRTEPLPSAEIDAAGKVYVVWQDCSFRPGCPSNDLVMTTTTESGYPTWSPPSRIPIDPTTSGIDHFIPGLAVDAATSGGTAALALAYYYYPDANCTFATCQLDVGFISSGDGGATWSPSSQIAGPMSLGWLPSTTGGWMVGDYISTSFSAGVAHPFFALAHAPSGSSFDEAIYTR
jgi:hypothetical protein